MDMDGGIEHDSRHVAHCGKRQSGWRYSDKGDIVRGGEVEQEEDGLDSAEGFLPRPKTRVASNVILDRSVLSEPL